MCFLHRADKLKKAMKMSGRLSETDSERSHSQRNSAEVTSQRSTPNLPVENETPLFPQKIPEKGILKKQSSESTDSLQSGSRAVAKRLACRLGSPCRQSSSGTSNSQDKTCNNSFPRVIGVPSSTLTSQTSSGSISVSTVTETKAFLKDSESNSNTLSREKLYLDDVVAGESDLENILGEDEFAVGSSSETDECATFLPQSSKFSHEEMPLTSITRDSSQTRMTEITNLSRSSSSVEDAKTRLVKLKNIDELLRQIDEQFSNVLHETGEVRQSVCEPQLLAATEMDDMPAFEPEVDRTYQLFSRSRPGNNQHSPFSTLLAPSTSDSRLRSNSASDTSSVNVNSVTNVPFGATFTRSSTNNGTSTCSSTSLEKHAVPFVVCAPLEMYKTPLTAAKSFTNAGNNKPSAHVEDSHEYKSIFTSDSDVPSTPDTALRRRDGTVTSPGRRKSPSRIPIAKARKSPTKASHCKVIISKEVSNQSPDSEDSIMMLTDGDIHPSPSSRSPISDTPLPCVPYRGVKGIMGSPPPIYKPFHSPSSVHSVAANISTSASGLQKPLKIPPPVPSKPSRSNSNNSNITQSNMPLVLKPGDQISEGYHSDHNDDSVVLREIPASKSHASINATPLSEMHFSQHVPESFSNDSLHL